MNLNGRKILIVDDEDFIREHLAWHLEKLGCETVRAADGKEALALAAEKPDLILMDVKMPLMDGYETTKELKGNPETQNIPIILLSAKAQRKEIEEGMSAGADCYLTKPASLSKILETMEQYLARRTDKG